MCSNVSSSPSRAASPKKNQNPTPPPSKVSVTAITPAPIPPVSRRAQKISPLSASTVIPRLGQASAAGMVHPPATNRALAKSGANVYRNGVPAKIGFCGGRLWP